MKRTRWIPAVLALALTASVAGCSSGSASARDRQNDFTRTTKAAYRHALDDQLESPLDLRPADSPYYYANDDGSVLYYSITQQAMEDTAKTLRGLTPKPGILCDDRSGPATLAQYSKTPIPSYPHG